MTFEIIKHSNSHELMRAGEIYTPHGIIKTPAFTPVGTRAAIKGVLPDMMKQLGAQALLANAYHLALRPGEDIIDEAGGADDGGLGRFMSWSGPTLTDSGGFQVMSLGVGFKKVVAMTKEDAHKDSTVENSVRKEKLAFIDDDGVTFKSHIDGSMMRFSPEISMNIQHKLGADIIFAFDELTTLSHDDDYHEISLIRRTHPWAQRCLNEHAKLTKDRKDKPYQMLYGVLQGANIESLRRLTARTLANMESQDDSSDNVRKFDGFGYGGAFEKEKLGEIIGWCSDELNKTGAQNKPRHLLGISGLRDIFLGIENGVDTFDCVSPSREGRNGALYTENGRINIKNAKFARDWNPIDNNCKCYTCQNYSKAYLHHLLKVGELNGATLSTIHNEYFVVNLINKIRLSILEDSYAEFKQETLSKYTGAH